MPDQHYRREDRIRSKAEYERVLQRKCSVRGRYLLIYGCENDVGRVRLGRIVSKRWGNAVARNRIRRWMREVFRCIKQDLPTIDLVLIPVSSKGFGHAAILAELPVLAGQVAIKLAKTGS